MAAKPLRAGIRADKHDSDKWPLGWRLAFIIGVCAAFWIGAASAVLLLTRARAETPQHQLERVNQAFNWLAPEDWRCTDFAFAKNTELLREGFPADKVHLAEVTTEDGVPHMVVIADLGARQIVLDNRFAWTQDWSALKRRGYELGAIWGVSP